MNLPNKLTMGRIFAIPVFIVVFLMGYKYAAAIIFILAIMIVMIVEAIKRYKKRWNEISQMFLIGSLSGIAVLGDVIRGYLPVNLILLFVFVNMGINWIHDTK